MAPLIAAAPLITAGLGAATAIATPIINNSMQKKQAQMAQKPLKTAQLLPAASRPLVGETDTELKPGQKINGIYTTPQGILSDAKTGRQTLLGG